MQNTTGNPYQKLHYAELSESQKNQLKSLESKFNEEFGCDFSFLVIDSSK